jgi:hypothetical protein
MSITNENGELKITADNNSLVLNSSNNTVIDATNNIYLNKVPNIYDGINYATPVRNLNGSTAFRPTNLKVGDYYFDTQLGKPIWLKATPSTWVDANGTVV